MPEKDQTMEDVYKKTLGEVPWRTRGGLVGEARRQIGQHTVEKILSRADSAAMAIDRAEKSAIGWLKKKVNRG